MNGQLIDYLLQATGHQAGDPATWYAAAYQELRALAARQRGRLPGLAGSDTSLVHEAYLKLRGHDAYHDAQHFFATASRAMRQILVDLARSQAADKRGGGVRHETLDDALGEPGSGAETVLDVDRALVALAAEDAWLAELVELRFFGGLGLDEIATSHQRSERSLKRDWVKARTFLRLHVADYEPCNDSLT